jgi:RNA recognition motif-containing protein
MGRRNLEEISALELDEAGTSGLQSRAEQKSQGRDKAGNALDADYGTQTSPNAETMSAPPKGRKRDAEQAELEIDVDAPEPPSKKALRRAKKVKNDPIARSSAIEEKAKSNPTKSEGSSTASRSNYGIWIGNMSFGTTADDLRQHLTSHASNAIRPEQITRVNLPQGPPKFGKPQNKGFAYVDFVDENSLQAALKLSESMLGGRRLLIKNAKSFEGRPEQKSGQSHQQATLTSRKLFVGNLPFTTNVERLEAHFSVCGSITHTHVATFEDSGKCKGFAWVEFEDVASAETAMRGWVETAGDADGKKRIWVSRFEGQKLRMEFAEDKTVRYEKRFGKNAKRAAAGDEGTTGVESVVDDMPRPDSATDQRKRRIKSQGRYSEQTVQQLTGAITESTGQRTVFE